MFNVRTVTIYTGRPILEQLRSPTNTGETEEYVMIHNDQQYDLNRIAPLDTILGF